MDFMEVIKGVWEFCTFKKEKGYCLKSNLELGIDAMILNLSVAL